MKKYICLILIVNFFLSCSKESIQEVYPRKADVKFTVTADSNRECGIITQMENTNDTIASKTPIGSNLPFSMEYAQQDINFGMRLKLNYVDFSILPINGNYEPYTIVMKILVDDKEVKSKTVFLPEIGGLDSLIYEFK